MMTISMKVYVTAEDFKMKRLENNQYTIYDAQILIYYCFLYKNHRIIELTNKARILTEFLINNDIQVIVPESIIIEIRRKGFEKIISEYTDSSYPSQVLGLPINPSNTFKYRLQRKIEGNFNKMINSSWFEVNKYIPSLNSINSIKSFFENIEDEDKLEEFLTKKNRVDPVPSNTDLELIAFSKDMKAPVVSNDYDITFFAEELFKKDLSYYLYDFMDLEIYAN